MKQENASDISAAVMTTINLAALTLSSEASGILSAFAPIIQNGVQRVLINIGPNKLTEREKVRVGSSVYWAIKAIEEHQKACKTNLMLKLLTHLSSLFSGQRLKIAKSKKIKLTDPCLETSHIRTSSTEGLFLLLQKY